MTELFKRLDGMKSNLGLVAYGAGELSSQMGWMDATTWAKILPIVLAFTGIGIAHKLKKMETK